MKIVDFGQVSPRLIWINCIFHGIRLRIVSAYAPTEEAKYSAKDHFYKTLRDQCVVGSKQQLILGGDLNPNADFGKSFMGGKKCDVSGANNNGTRLYEFLNLKEYALLNSWLDHKKLHKDTCYSNTGSFSKTIDYIAQSRWLMQYCVDCRVRTSFTCKNSDHRLPISRIKTPNSKSDFKRFVRKKPKSKFDLNSLKDEYIRTNFINKVNELCASIEDPNVTVKDCAKFTNILESAAGQTLSNVVKTAEAYMWDNDQILSDLHNKGHQLDRNQHKPEFKQLSNQIKKRFDKFRNIYLPKFGK